MGPYGTPGGGRGSPWESVGSRGNHDPMGDGALVVVRARVGTRIVYRIGNPHGSLRGCPRGDRNGSPVWEPACEPT